MAFFTQNKAKIYKILIIPMVFEKNANFFAENWRKSQKIVIITSTPGRKYHHIFILWLRCKGNEEIWLASFCKFNASLVSGDA
jgi:hypothetical protein